MKSILIAILLTSTSVFAAGRVESGTYKALDVETSTIDATLVIRDNQTANFKVTTPDFTMPEPGCEGAFTAEQNLLAADMKCPVAILPELNVKIDLTNVTPESVRSADGALVDVQIDAFGSDPIKFRIKKIQ